MLGPLIGLECRAFLKCKPIVVSCSAVECIDLPVFSIHGNHDDPTREGGGTEPLAALDLLAASNLVNYFGRQDQVDKVEVAPVLFQKGSSRVALYGMGSLRDERLNRMWHGKKVRFLRPDDDGDDDGWFSVFCLHQNRDLGRGGKNCVHETMIPEWMDLVVWGHEHECLMDPQESVVGTFRITQPGSTVATSLTQGETVRKHLGLLDIRGNQFRMTPVPLVHVRSFLMAEVSLLQHQQKRRLDPEDPRIDEKVSRVLEDEVRDLLLQAREKYEELREAAAEAGNDPAELNEAVKLKLQKPQQVLLRLKVEHSGFATLNNQRFGAKFVGEVVSRGACRPMLVFSFSTNCSSCWCCVWACTGQPGKANTVVRKGVCGSRRKDSHLCTQSDLLLFHRRKQSDEQGSGKHGGGAKKGSNNLLDKPIAPEELEEMNVEELVKENLEVADKKLEILSEKRLSTALDEFVSKESRQAMMEATSEMVSKQRNKLIQREVTAARTGSLDEDENEGEQEEEEEMEEMTTKKAAKRKFEPEPPKKRKTKPQQSSSRKTTGRKRAAMVDLIDDDDDDDDDERATTTARGSRRRPQRGRAGRVKYEDMDEDADDDSFSAGGVEEEPEEELDADSYEKPMTITAKKRGTKRERTARGTGTSSRSTQSKLRVKKTRKTRGSDGDGDAGNTRFGNSYGVDDDWGTVDTKSQM